MRGLAPVKGSLAEPSADDSVVPITSRVLEVLVVENEHVDYELLQDILADSGRLNSNYNFSRVDRLAKLLERFESGPCPDVVLLDLHLPDAGGVDTLNRVQHLLHEAPIVVMTDLQDDEVFDHALTLGFQDFFQKCLLDGDELDRRVRLSIARFRHTHRLFQQANHDVLTGLANRGLFYDRLSHALERAHRSNEPLALMLIDIDDFKSVNDTLGHNAGDTVLKSVAQALNRAVRQSDTVSRIGGDEFAVLLEDVPYPHAAFAVAKKILAAPLAAAAGSEPRSAPCSLSVGIAIYEPGAEPIQIQTLFQRADTALYRAKHNGKNRYCTYTESLEGEMGQKLRFDDDVQRAVERRNFVPYFQPIVDVHDRSLRGVEMLMRWPHAGRGMIYPADAVPALERMNLLNRVSLELMRQSLAMFKTWRDSYPSAIRLSLNVSPSQLTTERFAWMIEELLLGARLSPVDIQLELTEDLFIDTGDTVKRNLHRLNYIGVPLVIDDFGMGHGSYSYLKRFRIGGIKIDRSVVAGITRNRIDAAIAESMVVLARGANLELTAEGVENRWQNDKMRELGLSTVQGYLHGHPMDALSFAESFNLPLPTLKPQVSVMTPRSRKSA